MNAKDMYTLNIFEGTKDILDEEIVTESSTTQEFAPGSAAAPATHIDSNASGENDVAPKPAETPSAKPADGELGPVNANTQTETPSAKPYDATAIPSGSKITMTEDQYNKAVDDLQKSFESATDLLRTLHTVEVIKEDAATDAEKDAMKLITEMAESKPTQFNEWVSSIATANIFDALKAAAEKSGVAIENEKAWKAAKKDVEVISEKLADLSQKVHELGTKAGKDVSKKIDRITNLFDKTVCGDESKKAE